MQFYFENILPVARKSFRLQVCVCVQITTTRTNMFEDVIGKFAKHFVPERRKHVLTSMSMVDDVVVRA